MSELSPLRQTTASMAPIIVYGTEAERYQLWAERTGAAKREDLSRVFPVQFGRYLEQFGLDWIERETQHELTERQNFVPHRTLKDISATLDAYRAFDNAVIEYKTLSPFSKAKPEGNDIGFVQYYGTQAVVQADCRGATSAFLAVQQGNSPPQLYEVPLSAEYTKWVLERLVKFQLCVDNLEPPGPAPKPPVPPELWRAVDLDAENLRGENWIPAIRPALDVWRQTRPVAKEHEQAKADVKLFLPPDVGLVTYGQISIKRARNGAVTIAAVEQ